MKELVLFSVSVFPVIFLGKYIYEKDKNKEPAKLLVKLFLSGIISCFLVLILSFVLGTIFPILTADHEKLNLFELIIYSFVGVALIEEICKWIMTYFISFNDNDFDEIYDIIVYSVFVSLGFAFFENLIYVYSNGIATGIVRSLLAVPGHACNGVFMGYYLGLSKLNLLNNQKKLKNKNLFFSILVPVILHGFYDYCLFTGNLIFILLFFIFIINLYKKTIKKIDVISSINRKMKYKDNYCPICGHIVDSNYCPICGRKND